MSTPPPPLEATAKVPPRKAVVPITVEVFHDTVCPWCRIGMAHLDKALQGWEGPPVNIVYRPFLLSPDAPPEGYDLRQHLAEKYGAARLTGMFMRVTEVGRQAGLVFRFDKVRRGPDSSLSHALIAWAPPDRQHVLVQEITRAYFEEGADIGRTEVLVQLAANAGLDPVEAKAALEDPTARTRVKAEVASTRTGITGVPHFVIDGTVKLQGAMPTERMRAALEKVAKGR